MLKLLLVLTLGGAPAPLPSHTHTSIVPAVNDQFVRLDPLPSGGSPVTDASNISFDQADLTNIAGFNVYIDGASPVDIGIPASQAPLVGGGITFTFAVSLLSLTNGQHTLTIKGYNDAGTESASGTQLVVVKS